MSLSLSLVLSLLLISNTLKGRGHLLNHAAMDPAAAALTADLRQALQESLGARAANVLPGLDTVPQMQRPLPRDPFAFRALPVAPVVLPQTLPAVQQPPPPPPPVENVLRLKATAIDRYGALAFINDQALSIGQSILGYTVVHISEGQVELTGHGQRLWLTMEAQ